MKAPLSWLRDFAPFENVPGLLADMLNQIGLIVEGVHAPGAEVGGVTTVKVLHVEPHPDADRLMLVDIEHADGEIRVVCGARNYQPGDVVPWAGPGATLPGGFKIEKRKIRGQVSHGMLCSQRELGISEDHEGIMILAPDTAVGQDIRDVLGLDDVIFDLEITPNRPDAMSVVGVARDLAAAMGLPFTLPTPHVAAADGPPGNGATLVVESTDRCPRYVARCGTVTVGPSPSWLAQRLVKAGMRPISNVVDVTNYVMLERGQPLHAFDLGLLGGRGILVRTARDGETIVTLDDVERTLSPDDLLICDANGTAQAVAGVMGGGGSEVSDATTEVLLESAYFMPESILQTSKRLGLRTESSARFERGVDPNGVLAAADRAWELFAEVAGGQAVGDALDSYPDPIQPARVHLRVDRVNAVLGSDIPADGIRAYLQPLGMDVDDAGAGAFEVTVPTYRPDITREIDLVEEVARHHGYNNIERTLPRMSQRGAGLTAFQRTRLAVRQALAGRGLNEATTFSLTSAADLQAAGLPGEGIEVENPLRAEESLLRPAILPGLLRAVAHNAGQGHPDVALFEIGHVFLPPPAGQTLPDEREHLAAVVAGTIDRRPHEAPRAVTGHDATGHLEAVATALGLADFGLRAADRPGFARGRAAAVLVDGEDVGTVGEIDPGIVSGLGLTGTVAAYEVNLVRLDAGTRPDRRIKTPSRFPASSIDLAFVVDDTVAAGDIAATLRSAAGELCESVKVFDIFRSDALGPDRKSLAYALRFRAPDRTLTDAEVGELRTACINAVSSAHGAELRG